MLTLRKISVVVGDEVGALRPARYLLEKPADGRAPRAIWLGSSTALDRFGLHRADPVALEQLVSALQGQSVEGEQVRVPGKVKRDPDGPAVPCIAGLDLTFSAPKSVSVLWSQVDSPRREEIERAMLVAADAAIEYMVKTKPVVYRREGGKRVREPGAGMLAAAALHLVARRAADEEVPSPQLHVHGFLLGVERGDGALVAPNGIELFKRSAPLEGGALARAVLADELVGLGYRVRPQSGRGGRFFELEGVPEPLLEQASGRTREVRRTVDRLERERGAKVRGGALAVAALETRQAKGPQLDPAHLAAVWAAQAGAAGFGRAAAAALAASGSTYRGSLEERRAGALEAFAERLASFGPTVSFGEARALALEVAPGRLGGEEAGGFAAALEGSGGLFALAGERATTIPPARLEQQLLEAAAESGRGGAWSALLAPLGERRDEALQSLLDSSEAAGRKVTGCAAGGRAARLLGAFLDRTSYSIDGLVRRLKQGALSFDGPTLLVLDEADRVGLAFWAEIAELCRDGDIRLIAIAGEARSRSGAFATLLDAGVFAVTELPGAESQTELGLDPDPVATADPGEGGRIAVPMPAFESLPRLVVAEPPAAAADAAA